MAKILALTVFCLLALGLCLTGKNPLALADRPLTACLALAALWFECRAIKLPGAGVVSCALPVLLAMGLRPQVGLAAAGLTLLMGVFIRQLWKGHPQTSLRLLEGLIDLAPGLAALAAVQLVSQPGIWMDAAAATIVYVCLSLLFSELLADELPAALRRRYRTVRGRLVPLAPVLCVAGLSAAFSPVQALLVWPMLEIFQAFVRGTVLLEEQVQRQDVARDLKLSQIKLEQASENQDQLRQDLSRKVDEYRTLETASRALLNVQSRQQTAQEIVQLCRSLVQCTSVVVFLQQESQLVPVSYSTPAQARLLGAPLAGLREPVAEAAFRSGTAQSNSYPPQQRIFGDEPCALAFPLGTVGVLYVGKAQGSFGESEVRSLGQAASQGGLGLHIAHHLQSLQESLQRQSWLSNELKVWSDSVEWLLVHSTDFLDKLEMDVLLERLTRAIQALFRYDSMEICLSGSHSLAACQAVIDSRKPLLIEQISSTRFQGHQAGQQSFLCVPILHSDLEKMGLIVLGAEAPGAFQRQHCDLLSLLGYLAATAWKNAELYAQTRAAQSQLVQAGKLAAVGQLAAGVAHELNTPLAAMVLSVEMAQNLVDSNPELARKRLDRTLQMIEQSRVIVQKLLYYSRDARTGQRPTDLNALVTDTLGMMSHPMQSEGVSLQSQLTPVPEVLVNQNELQQVLLNLLHNARDAVAGLPPERKQISIHTGQDQNGVFLLMTDLGCGIDEKDAPKVFDPFFTTKPVGQGTGLGLSISQQILSAHGGSLTFTSQLDRGSQFRIVLPISSSDDGLSSIRRERSAPA